MSTSSTDGKKYDVYGIGAALVDMEFEVTDEFLASHNIEKGMMTIVEPDQQQRTIKEIDHKQVKRASGGSAANTIIGASYFGASVFYSCKAANDETGDFFVKDIVAAGVDCNLEGFREEGITGKCLVMITPDAERTMNTDLAISASLGIDELNEEALANSQYYYMEGYLSTSDTGREAAIAGRKIAETNNVKTVLTLSDPSMVEFFQPQLREMLGDGVDLLFCNEDEAKTWTNCDDLDSAAEAIKTSCKSFAITLGARGALVYDGKIMFKIAPNETKAIDTNGAGDMFAGAFLYAISQGLSFEEAGKLASLASSEVVAKFGPRLEPARHQILLNAFRA